MRLTCGPVILAFILIAAFAPTLLSAREKVDVITLEGGDRVTGEIKRLDFGKLAVSTDHMGTVEIQWVGVESIDSPQLFEVEDQSGAKYYGVLTVADEDGWFAVIGDHGFESMPLDRVVRIAQIEESRWKRWRGYVDLGYSFTSANSATDASFQSEASYRSERFVWRTTASSTVSDRQDAPTHVFGSLSTGYERFFRGRWFWVANVGATRNTELDLERRVSAGGGFGRYLVQSSRSQLKAAIGLAGNRETYVDGNEGKWTAEGILSASYDLFLFEGRETSFSFSAAVFPSLNTGGRYRMEVSSALRRKLIRDFTLAISVDNSYDSKPPSETAEKNDLRLRTTLGWSF